MSTPDITPNTPMRLVGDIGGTNARFALVPTGSQQPGPVTEIRCADFPSPIPAMRQFLSEHGDPELSEAIIAVGTPIVGDRLAMTNNHWVFSVSEVKASFALQRLEFINDFTAQALSLPGLEPEDLVQVGGGTVIERGPKAVLGPGTGLGVSGLIPAANDGWTPLQGEGGHVAITPLDAREREIVAWLETALPESKGHVSAERFLSGPGLTLIYQGLCAADGVEAARLTPGEVSDAALTKVDSRAEEALAIFCRQLGSVSSDLALTLGATGGVYIAGGIVPRLLDYFVASDFRTVFERKGRFSDYVESIASFVVVRSNPALLGAASLL